MTALRRLLAGICCALIAGAPRAAFCQDAGEENGARIQIPDQIPGFVHDGAGMLSPATEDALKEELSKLAEFGVQLYAITIAEAPDGFPVGLAGLHADRWSGGTMPTAVVLRSPGSPARLDISVARLGKVPGGEAAISELKLELNAIREKPARTEEDFADAVRLTRQAIVRRLFPAETAAAEAAPAAWTAGDLLSLIGIPLLAVAVIIGWLAFRRRGGTARVFPATEPRRRFSGPHSGGNNAQIHYGD